MRTTIRRLTAADLDAAARLLAERHRNDRLRTPALSPRFEDAAAVRPLIEAELARPLSEAFAALRGDDLIGFLIGAVSLPPAAWWAGYGPRRSGEIGYAGHAAAGARAHEVYRELYAALAPHFHRYGAFDHAVEVNAADPAARDAWYSLGFGQTATLAVRETAAEAVPERPASATVEVRRAGPEDLDLVVRLADVLGRHHSSPPIFLPYIPEEVDAGFRAYQADLLAKPENAHWVAFAGEEALAVQTFHEQDFAEMARPERSIYLFMGVTTPAARGGGVATALLRRSLAWARQEGYERCTLHFLSANISAARFWLGSGFLPLTHRLTRHVDERIAWAHVRD